MDAAYALMQIPESTLKDTLSSVDDYLYALRDIFDPEPDSPETRLSLHDAYDAWSSINLTIKLYPEEFAFLGLKPVEEPEGLFDNAKAYYEIEEQGQDGFDALQLRFNFVNRHSSDWGLHEWRFPPSPDGDQIQTWDVWTPASWLCGQLNFGTAQRLKDVLEEALLRRENGLWFMPEYDSRYF